MLRPLCPVDFVADHVFIGPLFAQAIRPVLVTRDDDEPFLVHFSEDAVELLSHEAEVSEASIARYNYSHGLLVIIGRK